MSAAAPSQKARPPVRSRWPRPLRRGPMEFFATILIAAGVLMLLQPFALVLYTWSFATTLVGVVLFTAVTKFPE